MVQFWFPPCSNQRCREQDPQRMRLQGSFWNDQWVHYCQTLDYINLDEELARKFLSSPRSKSVLHMGVVGEVPAGGRRLVGILNADEDHCPNCGATVPHGFRFCGQCGRPLPENLFAASGSTRGADYIIGSDSGRCAWAILRDLESSRSLKDEAERSVAEGAPSTDPYRWGVGRAEGAGVHDVVLVDSFPITTAALGYTRNTSGPPSWLRAFETLEEHYRELHPVYTQTVETEAWLVQLKAATIARWLIENGIEPFASELRAADQEETALQEWFIERIARAKVTGSPADQKLYEVVFSLLHSYSHVVLLSLATQSGLEASSLSEMILTDALGFAIYAGDTDLGALTAAFEQLTGVVFASVDDYAQCKLDPTCSTDDGGACVGCIQLHHGCQTWNDNLSRAYLFGGRTANEVIGELRYGYLSIAATSKYTTRS